MLAGPVGLRQEHAPQHRRRTGRADAGRGHGRRQAGARRAAAARGVFRVPGKHAASLVHDSGELPDRPEIPGRRQGRAGCSRDGRTRDGRHGRLCAALSDAALGRHAPAREHGPRHLRRHRHPADGRAVRGARRADADGARRRPLDPSGEDRQDHRLRDPQPGGGRVSLGSHRRHDDPGNLFRVNQNIAP